MSFSADRLKKFRESLGITKAEAARRLNLTAMGYYRYESGDRIPSYQTISFMAQTFGTSYDYLCELTDDPKPNTLTISKTTEPELYRFIEDYRAHNAESQRRLLAYYRHLEET